MSRLRHVKKRMVVQLRKLVKELLHAASDQAFDAPPEIVGHIKELIVGLTRAIRLQESEGNQRQLMEQISILERLDGIVSKRGFIQDLNKHHPDRYFNPLHEIYNDLKSGYWKH